MDKLILSKTKIPDFIKKITDKYQVYAPVKEDDMTFFRKISSNSKINLDFTNSVMPPKALLFNQTETMFEFTTGEAGDITPSKISDEKTIIFGIRPCDARSFSILDNLFKADFEDPYYLNKRKNTFLIGLSCNQPEVNCFCTSLDDGPASTKHLDMLLTDIGDKYFVEVISDKGKQIAADVKSIFTKATDKEEKKKKDIEKKSIDSFTRYVKTKEIVEKLDKIFDSTFWKKAAMKCLGCGTCTYLCPTCHCFDIQDETYQNKGARVRIWDTCMNPEYTLHASGHNPRPARLNRVRNRIFHKYNYYPKNFDIIACVGCGRCVDNCPVNCDIIETVNKVVEEINE